MNNEENMERRAYIGHDIYMCLSKSRLKNSISYFNFNANRKRARSQLTTHNSHFSPSLVLS